MSYLDSMSTVHLIVVACNIPLLLLGFCELVTGSVVYAFAKNVDVGAFYVGMFAMPTAVISIYIDRPCGQGFYIAFTVITCIISVIACFVDHGAWQNIGFLKLCANTRGEVWGNNDYLLTMTLSCADKAENHDSCYCIRDMHNDITKEVRCFEYVAQDGFDSDDCEPVLDEYGELVYSSFSLCLAIFFLCFALSIVACSSCCCLKIQKQVDQGGNVPQLAHQQQAQQSIPVNVVPYTATTQAHGQTQGQPPAGQRAPVYYAQAVPISGQQYQQLAKPDPNAYPIPHQQEMNGQQFSQINVSTTPQPSVAPGPSSAHYQSESITVPSISASTISTEPVIPPNSAHNR